MSGGPNIGERGPDLALTDQDGEPIRLSDYRGDKVVVLYFYPKDFTPGCTAEAKKFRDAYEVFSDAGAEVVGVSADDPQTHKAFADCHELPFRLLSDEKGQAARAWGVKKTLGLFPGRVTFVIDKDGVVRHRFQSALRATRHVDEALDVVRSLR